MGDNAPLGLTDTMSRTLAFIRQAFRDRGVPPSYSEIADHIGVRSKSNVTRIIIALEQRGHIRRAPNKARSLMLVAAQTMGQRLSQLEDEAMREHLVETAALLGRARAAAEREGAR